MITIQNFAGDKVPFEIINFPDGHRHLRFDFSQVQEAPTALLIKIRIKTFDDLFILKQAVNALRETFVTVNLNLEIVYLLAARFDRRMVTHDSFDLKIVADYINDMKFATIGIVEPHSQVSLSLIDGSYAISPLDHPVKAELLEYRNTKTLEYDACFVVPDLGAVKRVEHLLKGSSPVNIVYSNKTRNLKTGDITGIEVLNPQKLLPTVIIFDDLCDGGRTFTELAKVLRPMGVTRIILAVAHGLFSKGIQCLVTPNEEGSYVDRIITTNSYQDMYPVEKPSVLKVVEVI